MRPPPGLAVLLNLMSGRQLEKALLLHVLQPGHEELAVSSICWLPVRSCVAGSDSLNTYCCCRFDAADRQLGERPLP
jgi:hypothetical protein